MTELPLNDRTVKTPLRDLLDSAGDEGIHITDAVGNPVARILIASHAHPEPSSVEEAERETEELRRRRAADQNADVTTEQLLARTVESN